MSIFDFIDIGNPETAIPVSGDVAGKAHERDIQDLQWQYLQNAITSQESNAVFYEQMRPYILEALGYTTDAEGNIVKMPEDELTAAYKDYALKALRGELEVSPALEASLQKQQGLREEGLSRSLGSNWAETTPGIQSMAEFQRGADITREEARRGMISTSGGLYGTTAGVQSGLNTTNLGNMLGVSSYNPYGTPNFSGALQPYQYYAGLASNLDIANLQAQTQRDIAEESSQYGALSGLFGGIGSFLGGMFGR